MVEGPAFEAGDVTRIEVIDGYGRVFSRLYGVPGAVVCLGDGGRLLSVYAAELVKEGD